jgi:hypothetical protein
MTQNDDEDYSLNNQSLISHSRNSQNHMKLHSLQLDYCILKYCIQTLVILHNKHIKNYDKDS